ncbi:heterokaryon incompatibility protein-domain-containing protein [Amylocarpus encephaloides]|uniref:Heterokaryon incompatibility protein-domain-containing protein n=1 Tax=Amylocarpus encephaloides TaxID=45428 RepID=A0A9P8C052_9HELO|nr:heterokaryon incompatibility protein-domain-containing protein [Amylocarpus encephaloides]
MSIGDPAAEFVKGRGSYPYLATDLTFHFIHKWLRECKDHVECGRTARGETGPGPSRLLYLDPTEPNGVKIVESVETVEYAALSYCWGKDASMQLLRNTIELWKQSLPFQDLPKTIQDAIFTCRKIGVQYLWVDRLCIIQDDPKDLSRELSIMVNIYRRSSLTLCAGSAESAVDGFLQSRKDAANIMSETRTMLQYVCVDGTKGTVGLKAKKFQDDEFVPDNIAVGSRELPIFSYSGVLLQSDGLALCLW